MSEYVLMMFLDGNIFYYFMFEEVDDVIIVDVDNVDFYVKIYMLKKGERGWGKLMVLDEKINCFGINLVNIVFLLDGCRLFFIWLVLEGNGVVYSKIYMSEEGDGSWLGVNEV